MSNINIACNSKANEVICNEFCLDYMKYKDFKFEFMLRNSYKKEIIKNDRSNTCLSEKNVNNKLFVVLIFTNNLYLDLSKIFSLCEKQNIKITIKAGYIFRKSFYRFLEDNLIKKIILETEYGLNLETIFSYKDNLYYYKVNSKCNLLYYYKIYYFSNSVKHLQISFISDYYFFPNKIESIHIKHNNISKNENKIKSLIKIPYNLIKFTTCLNDKYNIIKIKNSQFLKMTEIIL